MVFTISYNYLVVICLFMQAMFATEEHNKKLQILSIGLKNNPMLTKFLLQVTTISFLSILPNKKFKKHFQKTFSTLTIQV